MTIEQINDLPFGRAYKVEVDGEISYLPSVTTVLSLNEEPHVKHLKEELGIAVDETTPDGKFTLQTVACVGACSLAAVVVVGDDTHGRVGPGEILDIVGALADEESEPS